MKNTKKHILARLHNFNWANNVKDINLNMKAVEELLVDEMVDVNDGFVFYINEKLEFEKTIIDFYFNVDRLEKTIFLFRKEIMMGFSIDGFITHNVNYINYVLNDN